MEPPALPKVWTREPVLPRVQDSGIARPLVSGCRASAARTLFYFITGHITQVLLAAQVSPEGSLPSCPNQVPSSQGDVCFPHGANLLLEGFCSAFVSSLPSSAMRSGTSMRSVHPSISSN